MLNGLGKAGGTPRTHCISSCEISTLSEGYIIEKQLHGFNLATAFKGARGLFTEHSLTDPEHFLADVEATAGNGLAIDHEEYLTGVNAIAVPIHGPEQSLIALLCVLGFASHFDDEVMQHAG